MHSSLRPISYNVDRALLRTQAAGLCKSRIVISRKPTNSHRSLLELTHVICPRKNGHAPHLLNDWSQL